MSHSRLASWRTPVTWRTPVLWRTLFTWSKVVRGVVVMPMIFLVASCGSSSNNALCGPSRTVGSVASTIAIGLFEFDETDGGSTLRIDVLTAITQLDVVVDEAPDDLQQQATLLKTEFEQFLDVADDLNWDDVAMSSDVVIDDIGADLNSDAGVYATTAVDSYISTTCNTGNDIGESDGAGLPTLPQPAIPSPTATDPPMEMVDGDQEARALGETIAALFGLELTPELAMCLGKTLSEIPDVSSSASPDEYQAQFQRAFDLCGIEFQIPVS